MDPEGENIHLFAKAHSHFYLPQGIVVSYFMPKSQCPIIGINDNNFHNTVSQESLASV